MGGNKSMHMHKLRLDRCGLSPIFATVILVGIVVVFGSLAYYFSNNLTRSATNNYVNTLSGSQQAISERIGFEDAIYSPSTDTLTVYIINSGRTNNLQIDSAYIYDSAQNLVGQPYSGASISSLQPIQTTGTSSPTPTSLSGNRLNIGQEGYFVLSNVVQSNGQPLTSGSMYTLQLFTKNGSNFSHDFTS